jgi:dTDP-4-dehydrorhamnose reductase
MIENKKILILGASGFIGGHMFRQLGPDRAIAAVYKSAVENSVYFDVLKMELADVIDDPATIGHAMVFFGETHPDACAANPEWSQRLNVDCTKQVIDQLIEWGVPLTFTSSEFVFDGGRGRNVESDPVNPINLYGRQKLEIERYLDAVGGEWTVMRLGKVFGSDRANAKLFAGWIDAVEAGTPVRIASDQIFSPIHVRDVVDGCLLAARKSARGLYHLCGSRPYSRLELFEMLVAEIGNYREVDIEVDICSIEDFDLPEPRPKDCSMLPDKMIAAIGLEITPIETICRKIVRNHYGDG